VLNLTYLCTRHEEQRMCILEAPLTA